MRRRDLIAGLVLASLATPALAAVKQISILHSGFPNRTPIHLLMEALRALGYVDGNTAAVELLGGEGDAKRLDALVAALASKKPDIIVALTSPAVLALKQASIQTPIVFAFVTDPVRLGIVANLSRPGSNFTGVTYSEATLGGKRLELLLDALPGTQRVAVIWSRAFPENAAIFEAIRQSAQVRGVEVFSREMEGTQDLAPAFDDAKRSGAQALIFLTDNLMFGRRKEIAALALSRQLPSIHSFAPEAADYGPDLAENYRRVAALADRVLKGARPADLPVEGANAFYPVRQPQDCKGVWPQYFSYSSRPRGRGDRVSGVGRRRYAPSEAPANWFSELPTVVCSPMTHASMLRAICGSV